MEEKQQTEQVGNGTAGQQKEALTLQIPRPDRKIFEKGAVNVTEHLMASPQIVPILDRIEYGPEPEGGIFVYHKNFLYPMKGFPTPEGCQANNAVKRVLISWLRFFTQIPIMGIWMLRKKNIEKFLAEFYNISYITSAQYYYEHKYYSRTSKEIWKFLRHFFVHLKIKHPDYCDLDGYAKMFVNIFEYDNAYMLRFQDLMNETTAKLLVDNPRREIKRLLQLFFRREMRVSLSNKMEMTANLFTLLLLIPKFKRAFVKAMTVCDFSKFQMDDIDRYQVLRWEKYNFLGQTVSQRTQTWIKMHKEAGVVPETFIIQHVLDEKGKAVSKVVFARIEEDAILGRKNKEIPQEVVIEQKQ